MLDISLVIGAIRLVVWLSAPFVIAALVGALLAGVLRVVTQIEDAAISFAGKISAVAVLFYLYGAVYSNKLFEYTQNLWGRSDLYY